MEPVVALKTRGLPRIEPRSSPAPVDCLDIAIGERAGAVRVHDPRLFQAARRGFCECLIQAIAGQPGLRCAEVDLRTASCQLEFAAGSSAPRFMAEALIQAVEQASAASYRLDQPRWWRHRRAGWSTLTAFRLGKSISFWEAHDLDPGRIRVRCPGARQGLMVRLAQQLKRLEGVRRCRISRWSRQVTIDFRPERGRSSGILEAIEQAWNELPAADSR